jgi:hypothetical protein
MKTDQTNDAQAQRFRQIKSFKATFASENSGKHSDSTKWAQVLVNIEMISVAHKLRVFLLASTPQF